MGSIAFILDGTFIYWSTIILALAALTAVFLFLWLYLSGGGRGGAAVLLVILAMPLSILFARVCHWYCRADAYESLKDAVTNLSGGGYALMGVFFGCLLAAAVLRVARVIRDLPGTLDCMALAGAAGIAVGRLSAMFNSTDRGMILEGYTQLPLVYPVANAVSGETEYRLATFLFQALVTAAIFLVLLVFFLRGRKKNSLPSGDAALLFLALYSASQIVFDSTRYDALFLRSNGFVSVVQILGLEGLLFVIVIYSMRMLRSSGFRPRIVLLWLGIAASLGLAGYMEYYVQRHGDQALFSYSVMSGALAAAVLGILALRHGTKRIQEITTSSSNRQEKTKTAQ